MRLILPLLFLFFAAIAHAQWTQTGGYVFSRPNTTIGTAGDVVIEDGTFRNRGRVFCENLYTDTVSTLGGTGFCHIRQHLGIWGGLLERLTFVMEGDNIAKIHPGPNTLHRLWLDKNAGLGAVVNLDAPLVLANQLRFVQVGNKLQLNGHDLTLQASSTIAGADNTNFVVTNDGGRLMRQNLGASNFRFPVGADADTYNPLQISNLGTPDDVGVTCLPDALQGGSTGAPFVSDAVAAAWQVTEATPGGSNLTLRASWYLPDELPNFNRRSCALRQHDGTAWQPAPLGTSTGAGPYTRVRAGLTELGYFAVLDASVPFVAADDRSASAPLQVQVWPNPATDMARVQVSGGAGAEPIDIQLFDEQGRLLVQEKLSVGTAAFSIPVGDLPPGTYLVEVRDGQARATGKFVKM